MTLRRATRRLRRLRCRLVRRRPGDDREVLLTWRQLDELALAVGWRRVSQAREECVHLPPRDVRIVTLDPVQFDGGPRGEEARRHEHWAAVAPRRLNAPRD